MEYYVFILTKGRWVQYSCGFTEKFEADQCKVEFEMQYDRSCTFKVMGG